MKPVRRPNTFPKRFLNQRSKPAIKDPIEVYCRIRPLLNRNEHTCIYPKDRRTVIMVPPDTIVGAKATKEVHYSYQNVFKEDDSQKDVFDHSTLPLIKDLLQGVNGLIFTYGITSSGKTFTMTGNPGESGILPKSLDVIFNSLQGCIASKFVFKPDKLNGFDVQTTAEAGLDLNKETIAAGKTKIKRKEYLGEWSTRIPESTVLSDVNTDSSYALFVSYVEIYNNYIYDLLEEIPPEATIKPKNPQPKLLREDSLHNMYVFGTTEIEVKSANEALEAFAKGKQRRHISHTALNAESSRSHSVFTVRVVQAPLDDRGVEVLQEKNFLTVSQLSMVDLAGSERSVRTKNVGHKLREAGNINASLMALRTCIEALRENQVQGGTKLIPYRESKLTHLFKTYFEGEGKIRMIVCVNPTVDDFEETTHVMRFAEMTQDVMISRATPVTTPVSYSMKAGRGNLYRTALQRAKEENIAVSNLLEPVVYSLGPEFPPLLMGDSEKSFEDLVEFLETRSSRRINLNQGLKQRQDEFRKQLTQVDKEIMSLKQENAVMHMDLKAREKQVKDLEQALSSTEDVLNSLRHKHSTFERQSEAMKRQLKEKDMKLLESEKEKENVKTRMQNQIELVKGRAKRLMEKTLAARQAEHEGQMCITEEKMRHLREILNSDNWEIGDLPLPENRPDIRMTRAKTTLVKPPVPAAKPFKSNSEPRVDQIEDTAPTTATQYKSIAVSNPRHRRSQSSSGDVWLEHKPVGSLELGTVLQPKMKKKISVSKLEVKDVVQNDVSKYILTHQEQDSKGEVETQLYKGDVIPSAGGGAQVIFHDIEKLRQASPPQGYNLRKRSAENLMHRDIETNCAIAVECHGVPSKVVKKSG